MDIAIIRAQAMDAYASVEAQDTGGPSSSAGSSVQSGQISVLFGSHVRARHYCLHRRIAAGNGLPDAPLQETRSCPQQASPCRLYVINGMAEDDAQSSGGRMLVKQRSKIRFGKVKSREANGGKGSLTKLENLCAQREMSSGAKASVEQCRIAAIGEVRQWHGW